MQEQTVFIVDDDSDVRGYLFTFLSLRGYSAECFENGDSLLMRLSNGASCGLVLLDVAMPGLDGIQVISRLRELGSTVPVVMLSGRQEIRVVVAAMQFGAMDFLIKPFDDEALEAVVREAFATDGDGGLNSMQAAAEEECRKDFHTNNRDMLRIGAIVRRVAKTDVPLLILGETGAGKEVMARFAHRHSLRAEKPFIKINCAALPHELLESELFGYEQGAFTGALNDKIGKFEQAHGGTLLLDEIGEMSPHLQSKLLHVLQDGSFSRLGARKTTKVDVRVIAATNIKLEQAIAEGKFREDLYYRLNVVSVALPALRERAEDIPELSQYFVNLYRDKYKSPITAIPASLLYDFSRFQWPGNIRELENIVKRYLLLQNAEDIARDLLPADSRAPVAAVTNAGSEASLLSVGAAAADRAERELVERVLDETHGNRKAAAQRLNVCYKALLNKLKRWNHKEAPTTTEGVASHHDAAA